MAMVRSWNKNTLTKKLEEFNFETFNVIETNTWWWSKFPKNLINRWRYREGVVYSFWQKKRIINYYLKILLF